MIFRAENDLIGGVVKAVEARGVPVVELKGHQRRCRVRRLDGESVVGGLRLRAALARRDPEREQHGRHRSNNQPHSRAHPQDFPPDCLTNSRAFFCVSS